MKTKSIGIKLSLNKKTIANLSSKKMSHINGGLDISISNIEGCNTCDFCDTVLCNSEICTTDTCDCQSNPAYISCPCPLTTLCL